MAKLNLKVKKLHEISVTDDIRYRGPISYQGFQILGWICIIAPMVNLILSLAYVSDPQEFQGTEFLLIILSNLAPLALPFLLIANFSQILNQTEGFKAQMLRNGLAALAIFAVSNLLFSRYVIGVLGHAVKQPEQVQPLLNELFAKYNGSGFVAFNLFIDLFICTLTMYFLNAHPKRIFTGKKVIILRLLVILPIAYEVASIILKVKSGLGQIIIPFWAFPLLTVKPPMTFLLFLFLSIHMSGRELRFRRNGRTHEEYVQYLKTRRNSLHFSICLVVAMMAAAILDFVLLKVFAGMIGTGDVSQEYYIKILIALKDAGFSKSWPLFLVAPILLLFSYNRIPKFKIISLLTPLAAIVIIVMLVLETIYQVTGILVPAEKRIDIDLLRFLIPQIMPQLRMMLGL